jgi:hypothetical protein
MVGLYGMVDNAYSDANKPVSAGNTPVLDLKAFSLKSQPSQERRFRNLINDGHLAKR